MATAKNTRARRARSVPHHAKRRPVPPDSAAGILSAVTRRLKFVMAAAFTVCAALESQNAELDAEFGLVLGRCVGDEVDKQIEAIERVIARLAGSRANAAVGQIRAIP